MGFLPWEVNLVRNDAPKLFFRRNPILRFLSLERGRSLPYPDRRVEWSEQLPIERLGSSSRSEQGNRDRLLDHSGREVDAETREHVIGSSNGGSINGVEVDRDVVCARRIQSHREYRRGPLDHRVGDRYLLQDGVIPQIAKQSRLCALTVLREVCREAL